MVGFHPNVTKDERLAIHASMGATLVKEIPQIHVDVVTVPEETVASSLANYTANPNVRYAELDQEMYGVTNGLCMIVPDDPGFVQQWGLTRIDAPEAWCKAAITPTAAQANVNIAVLDSGVDDTNPDLVGRVTRKVNLTDSPAPDSLGHGTHVAGIAASITNNETHGASIAFNSANIWDIKVIGDGNNSTTDWIASGIIDAAVEGADVINMSLAFTPAQTIEDAVNFAWASGVVIAAAAGNDNLNQSSFPARYENCISVAATDANDERADFSNFGEGVDVAAPGVDIWSTCPTFPNTQNCLNFGPKSGTSMATPFVAGLAGLIKATFPSLTNQQIRLAIESSTDEVPGSGVLYQFGRINADKAVIAAAGL